MEFHPFAEAYPLMPEVEFCLFKTGFKDGFNRTFPIVRFQGKILDGRNRYRACIDEKVDPFFVDFRGTEEEAKQFVILANEHRRHLATEWLAQRRRERIERVAAKREEGKSTRAIAASEGISQTQVQNDLKASVEQGCSTEPPNGTVTGSDGKNYTATKPKALCDRCKRVGEVKGCPACKDLRAASKIESSKKPISDSANGQDIPKDIYGIDIPKHARGAYCDHWIQGAIDFLAEFGEKFRKERLADGFRKRAKHYPFVNADDFRDGVGFVIQYLDQLLDELKEGRPAAVCPACGGERCAYCKMTGLVPRETYKDVKAKVKA